MAYPAVNVFSTFGYQNVYIPGYMGDGALQSRIMVGFTMNEDEFALNNYVTLFGADEPKFYYQRFYNADFVRVEHATALDARWADGAEIPRAHEGPRSTNQAVELLYYGERDYIGDRVVDLSKVGPLIPIRQNWYATRAMIRRAIQAHTALTTSGNYPSSGTKHYYATWNALATDAVTQGYPANYFGVAATDTIFTGTINDPLCGKALKHGVLQILKRSNGRVKPQDLVLLMNPNTANRLANSQEIRAYMAQQVGSIDVLKGQQPALWPTFGLPNPLYGLKVMVDATTKTTTKQDHVNEDTQAFVIQDGLVCILARPGAVTGMPGSEAFSSLALWQHKKWAMKPETFPDPQNHRVAIQFLDAYTVQLVSPEITWTIADATT